MYDESKLPRWVQERLQDQRDEIEAERNVSAGLIEELEGTQARLSKREKSERLADLDYRVLDAARGAITEAIVKELVGYNKPLSKITERVIGEHEDQIYSLINDELANLLGADEFRSAFKTALNDKLARVLIARTGGELEKRVNELRASPEARARITLAITRLVDELGNG